MTVEPANMSSRLEMVFSQDPLYRYCEKLSIEDEIIDEHMAGLNEYMEYSTTDFERFYCDDREDKAYLCDRSTMRHWLKELNRYVEAKRPDNGRNFTLDYRSIFRLRLAMLLRKNNVQLKKIKELLGITQVVLDPHETRLQESKGTDIAVMSLLQSGLFILNKDGRWGFNEEKIHEIVQQTNLLEQGNEQLETLQNDLTESTKQLEIIKEELELQRYENKKQNQTMQTLLSLYELQASSTHDNVEEQRAKLSQLRNSDIEAYGQTLLEIAKQSLVEKNKRSKSIFSRLFNKK